MAKCLDGTQGVYYTRKGTTNSGQYKVLILIILPGGGWCSYAGNKNRGESGGDDGSRGAHCSQREKKWRGSTKNEGRYNTVPLINPASIS